MIDIDLGDNKQVEIFEKYLSGIGITPRMVTNVDTGEIYIDGQHAADRLGVTRQNVNNCLNGRQNTVAGYRLVKAWEFRRGLIGAFEDYCDGQGTDRWHVMSTVNSRSYH